MHDLATVAPAFVEMAHQIVWATVATVDGSGRPRSRILHPYWEWDGTSLVGWVATGPTPAKRAHLEASPFVSVTYWRPDHDTCTAECSAELLMDDETRTRVWDTFKSAPAPVGYDPAIIPVWTTPTAETFAALRLDPWRLRVMPGEVMMQGVGETLTWRA
jgi:hypothetical protein